MPNENIPHERLAELKRRLEERQTPELQAKYDLVRQSFIGKERKGTQEVQEIIGDNDQDDFIPQFEAKLWDNECKLSVRYLSDEEGEEIVDTEKDKVKWRKGREEARFYNKPQNERHESGEFEFDIVLDEYTGKHEWVFSIRTRGLKFYRQNPLTDEEKFDKDGNEIAFQPDWITGGYVVYHESKKNNRIGGKSYATGKVCNIPLPVAIDAKGNEIFGTVDIDEAKGEMRVGVSDKWLKKAKYPVTIDPTFGYTTKGASGTILVNTSGSNQRGTIFAAPADGTIDSYHIYLYKHPFVSSFAAKALFYTVDSDGANSHGLEEIVSLTGLGATDEFKTFTSATNPTITTSNEYFIAAVGGAYSGGPTYYVYVYYDASGSYDSGETTGANYTTPADPWNITPANGKVFSMYATYTAAATPEVEQEGFAFGDDDGTESGHTLGTQDSNYTGEVGTKTLRMLLNATDDPATKAYKLKYQKNGTGGYVDVPVGDTSSDWYNPSWTYRVKITVDHTKVGSTLTDFPVYVDLSDLPAGFFSNVKSDGSDIRVTKSDGTTEVPLELVYISTGSSIGELHFKADSLSSSVDTDFYIYYGNSGASAYAVGDTYGRNNVWSSYERVFHMQDGTTSTVVDSTGNADGTKTSANNPLQTTSADVGRYAQDFDGEYIDLGDFLDSATALTFETVVSPDTTTQDHDLITKGAHSSNNPLVFWRDEAATDKYALLITDNGGSYSGVLTGATTATTAGGVDFVAITFTGGSNARLYVNGAEDANSPFSIPTVGEIKSTADTVRIGNDAGGGTTKDLDGKISEARISLSVRSGDWIIATQDNLSAPSSFYTAGSQETDSGGTELFISTSSNVAAGGEATTARLTAPSGKTTSDFDTGRRWDDENGSDSIDITADDYTELEWVLTTQSPATTSDYFDFRVYDGDTALDTYTVTPRWTIGTADTISEAGKVSWANISQAGTVTKANIAAIGGVTT